MRKSTYIVPGTETLYGLAASCISVGDVLGISERNHYNCKRTGHPKRNRKKIRCKTQLKKKRNLECHHSLSPQRTETITKQLTLIYLEIEIFEIDLKNYR